MRATTAAGPSGLVIKEFFAGHGVISKGWRDAGEVALEEVELYTDPHRKLQPRPDHDLSDPAVQARHLAEVASNVYNVEWIACPCTTYCDWNLQNGGTRTFDNPAGAPTSKEEVGNTLSSFGAQLFAKALSLGHFPIAESSGVSGRYPKQWNLPVWKSLLAREDVDFLEVDMCAYGLAPVDATSDCHFYRHRTALVFPRHAGFRAALFRLCPGLSARHVHIPLKGSRPGTDVARCTEAGVYAPQFVQAVVLALQSCVGGGRLFQPQSQLRAGGSESDPEEDEQRSRSPRRDVRSSREAAAEEGEENTAGTEEAARADAEEAASAGAEEAAVAEAEDEAEAEEEAEDAAEEGLTQEELFDQDEAERLNPSPRNPEVEAEVTDMLSHLTQDDGEDERGDEEEQATYGEGARAGEGQELAEEEESTEDDVPEELAVDEIGGDQ